MDEDFIIRLQDQTTEVIAAQLSTDVDALTFEEWIALEYFVANIGGVENARLAIEHLRDIDEAA